MARFEHEARVLSSLNHPHIAAVYGIEKGAAFEHGIPAPLLPRAYQCRPELVRYSAR